MQFDQALHLFNQSSNWSYEYVIYTFLSSTLVTFMFLSILGYNMASERSSYDNESNRINNNIIEIQSSAETLSSYPSTSQYEQGKSVLI